MLQATHKIGNTELLYLRHVSPLSARLLLWTLLHHLHLHTGLLHECMGGGILLL